MDGHLSVLADQRKEMQRENMRKKLNMNIKLHYVFSLLLEIILKQVIDLLYVHLVFKMPMAEDKSDMVPVFME